MKVRSLHARMMIVTAIWTAGILGAAVLAGMALVHVHPRMRPTVHYSLMTVAGVALITAGVSVIRSGLSPFSTLKERLTAVRDGHAHRLEGDYPTEVQPLVEDLNALLDDRERRVSRAVARAGDLAHGLKTPLAVLAQEVERAEGIGQHELAETLRQQVRRMQRQIESHLAQARATASDVRADARADVGEAARALRRTLEHLYADRRLTFDVDVPDGCVVRAATEDLEEMVGNLLDNACKWANSAVRIRGYSGGRMVIIEVDDDGNGLEPEMRSHVLRRGVRADEAAPGSGLGLAIVADLASAYGGSVALDRSPEGGVRARLALPAAAR